MAIVFLMGGVGNQLYQYATSEESDQYSPLFLNKWIRKLAGWTDHENILEIETASLMYQILAVQVLVMDILLYKIFKKTLFTDLDTMVMRSSSALKCLVKFGYFQNLPIKKDVKCLISSSDELNDGVIVIHVRGGDLVENIRKRGETIYNVPDRDYYNKNIKAYKENYLVNEIIVVTDDIKYCEALKISDSNINIQIVSIPLSDTIKLAVGAELFIGSGSTLSQWIKRLRGNKPSRLP